jgi:Protein of unknown function (DUF3168)
MPSSSLAVQQAFHTALIAHPAVIAALGGPRVYDLVPRGAALPYLRIAHTNQRDWSTGTEAGTEHTITVHVWSASGGLKQVHELIHAVTVALHDRDLPLDGHHLVQLRHDHSEARRDEDSERIHGLVRFRALTEPLT